MALGTKGHGIRIRANAVSGPADRDAGTGVRVQRHERAALLWEGERVGLRHPLGEFLPASDLRIDLSAE